MNYCNLFILTLDNRTIFLYAALPNDKSPDSIKKEFQILYPEYPPIHDITMVLHKIKFRDIDSYVLLYMHKHGIDKVRGGSFTTPILSNEIKNFISDRIKYIYEDLPQTHAMLNQYDNNSLSKVIELREKIKLMKPILTNDELNLLLEIQPNSMDIHKYNSLLNKCGNLYYQFCKQCPEGKEDLQKLVEMKSHIWLYSPNTALDSYFIYGHGKDLADKVIKCIEFMWYYLNNRTNELEFDITSLQMSNQLDLTHPETAWL